ncbi:MAG: Hpt domain-containing protein [Kiritimatiellae bacterium]|nr:Hpt domain-containing protein [Kiritimatiellia bacterium]
MKECCRKYLDLQFGDDEEIKTEIYEEYKNSMKAKTAEATASLESGDWVALDKIAHTIKGNALAVDDKDMADTAIDLRSQAKLHEAGASEADIARMRELIVGL